MIGNATFYVTPFDFGDRQDEHDALLRFYGAKS